MNTDDFHKGPVYFLKQYDFYHICSYKQRRIHIVYRRKNIRKTSLLWRLNISLNIRNMAIKALNYPIVTKSWQDNREKFTEYFQFTPDIRRMIYTTNTVEGYHRQIRKVTKKWFISLIAIYVKNEPCL